MTIAAGKYYGRNSPHIKRVNPLETESTVVNGSQRKSIGVSESQRKSTEATVVTGSLWKSMEATKSTVVNGSQQKSMGINGSQQKSKGVKRTHKNSLYQRASKEGKD